MTIMAEMEILYRKTVPAPRLLEFPQGSHVRREKDEVLVLGRMRTCPLESNYAILKTDHLAGGELAETMVMHRTVP